MNTQNFPNAKILGCGKFALGAKICVGGVLVQATATCANVPEPCFQNLRWGLRWKFALGFTLGFALEICVGICVGICARICVGICAGTCVGNFTRGVRREPCVSEPLGVPLVTLTAPEVSGSSLKRRRPVHRSDEAVRALTRIWGLSICIGVAGGVQ